MFRRLARPSVFLRRFSTATETIARAEPQCVDNLMQIGTRRIFEFEHDQYREMCRNFYKDKVVPFTEEWEKQGHVSREVWRQAGEAGMLGVTMPEEYGGMGLDALYAAVNWEEQSYSGATGPGWSLHSEICMPYILHYGSEEQKQKYLPKMCSGEMISAIAMTEPGAGSDLQGVRTTAIRQPDGDYIINGSKTFITNGGLSDLVIIVAKTDPNVKGAKGTSLFVVETNTPGFKKGRLLNKMGMKAQDTAELFFEEMRVPASALLGEEGKGFAYLMQELPQERILIADQGIAAAEAVYEATRTYVKERKAFGSTISSLQTVRHKLAETKTEIVIGRTFVDRCLELLKDGKLDSQTASMAKYWCTDIQNKVADNCVQLHGGWGYMQEFPVCKAFVDARVQKIYGGTNEIMKELISRTI